MSSGKHIRTSPFTAFLKIWLPRSVADEITWTRKIQSSPVGREIALSAFGTGYVYLIDPAREDWASCSVYWERLGVLPVGIRARFEAVSRAGDRDFCELLVRMQVE